MVEICHTIGVKFLSEIHLYYKDNRENIWMQMKDHCIENVNHEDDDLTVALVTGSSSGIGAQIALDLLSIGCHVIITGRDLIKINSMIDECKRRWTGEARFLGFQIDLMDYKQIDILIEFIRNKFNKLDILINNACYRGERVNILDEKMVGEFENIFAMNVSIPMYLIHKCLLELKSGQNTQIVINISSIASQVVVPLHGYSITKSCLSEMTRQLAAMAHDLGLISLTISPGPILTPERPHHASMASWTLMERVGTPREISNLVMQCLKNITLFNGKELFIDGGVLAKENKSGQR